jgi:hypothetical protein
MKVNCSNAEGSEIVPEVGQVFYGKTKALHYNRVPAEGAFIWTRFSPNTNYRYPVHLESGHMYEQNEVEVIRILPNAEVTC